MLGNEGDQQEKDCYHGDEDASRDPRSVETRPHEKRGNPAHSTHFTDRRGYALWPSSLVWTCPETRCGQCHSQSDEPGHTWYQTTRTPQEDVEPTTEGRHDGRGCDPGYGPRPDGVETEDKADPYEIGKRPLKVSKVSKHDAMLHYASFDVKLPNSIYSDYVISVFSYIIRFSLFLGIAYII